MNLHRALSRFVLESVRCKSWIFRSVKGNR